MKSFQKFGSLLLLAAICGCQSVPQITPEQMQTIADAVTQAQAVYQQIQPLIEELHPIVEQMNEGSAEEVVTASAGSCGVSNACGDCAPVARGRTSEWAVFRDTYAKAHPRCAVCGRPVENVHHGVPVHVDPTRELDPKNCYPFCRTHHFIFGHLGDWRSWNPDIENDIGIWRGKYAKRPR